MSNRNIIHSIQEKIGYNIDPEFICKSIVCDFNDNFAIMSALGYSGICLIHILLKYVDDLNIYFIDTGFHFQETLDLLHRLEDLWPVNFIILRPKKDLYSLRREIGEFPWISNPDLCCMYNKQEPLLSVIKTKNIWLSALRKDQSITRSKIEVIDVDMRGTLKIYPLAHWTSQQCWDYIHEYKLPYNSLHDKGYMSIGCRHCTTPILPGQHEREGRWNSMLKLECGIHTYGNQKDI